jgi:hypothetical protein
MAALEERMKRCRIRFSYSWQLNLWLRLLPTIRVETKGAVLEVKKWRGAFYATAYERRTVDADHIGVASQR